MIADPEISRVAGDVTRPHAPVPFSRDLGHLPGESGPIAGAATVVGMFRGGQASLSARARRHGPVFRAMLGLDPVVCVADPDLIWDVLRNDDGAFSTALAWTHFFSGLNVSGPGHYDAEPHRDVRQLMQPSFSPAAIAGYVATAQEAYARTIDVWVQNRRVRFKADVRALFAGVSADIFMGLRGKDESERLDRAMSDAWQSLMAMRRRTTFSVAWWRARRGVDAIWSIMRSQHMGGTDLLSRLRGTHDEANWLADEETRLRLFMGVMLGAFDTTASGSASMAWLLAKHPEWQERLREEARALDVERPSAEQLKGLELQDLVWKETLRLFPVAGQVSRQALREVRLGAFRVPAAACVVPLLGAASRDPAWWTDPLRFDPERFSSARAEDKRHKAIFLPFGGGAHACIGAQLAGAEVRAFWYAMLRKCRFRLARDYEAHHMYTPIGTISGDVELVLEPV